MIYEIQMSKGPSIKIDDDDLQKIQENIKAPLVRVKQGIINPSFMVSIIPTEEREYLIDKKVIVTDGVAKIIEGEKRKALVDKMDMKKLLK